MHIESLPAPTGNAILDLLKADFQAPANFDIAVGKIAKNQVLMRDFTKIDHIYFPKDALISLRTDLSTGFTAEYGQIGREGIVGISALLGQSVTASTAIALTAGTVYRADAAVILTAFDTSSGFRRAILAYMRGHMQESAQRIACNRFHSVTQQLCRTLLVASDRLGSEKMALTHEQLAQAVGCRREAISIAAAKLQNKELIRYAYGWINILDRAELESHSCECYDIIQSGFSELLTSNPRE